MPIKLEDLIPGGKANGKSLEDIAKHHVYGNKTQSLPKEEMIKMYSHLRKQLKMGIKVEREHADSDEKAREIAMDHLYENPDYYSKLDKAGLTDELHDSKNLTEMVGRIRKIKESSQKINGIVLKKGMKVQLKSSDEMLKNHYYEQFPEKYKKIIPTIAGTLQTIESISPTGAVESSNIKLVGCDLPIEIDDILKIVKRTI